MSWATWSWRASAGGGVTDSWGVYDPPNPPPTPSMTNDSAATILADWSRWTLSAFELNPMLAPALAMPAVESAPYTYTTMAGTALIEPAPGVLGHVTDRNSGTAGISLVASQATGPSHGTLSLSADGSFSYTPDDGFEGTDTFEYSVFDGRVDAVRPGIVTVVVE
jgi:hypothetical protein